MASLISLLSRRQTNPDVRNYLVVTPLPAVPKVVKGAESAADTTAPSKASMAPPMAPTAPTAPTALSKASVEQHGSLLVTYRKSNNTQPNHTLEREANNCVININTRPPTILCRPFDGGDVLANPDLAATEARVLRTGVYIFLYPENGGWSHTSPTLSKEERRRLIESSKVSFPKNTSYTYCFEVRGDEEYIYGGSYNSPTRLFLFAVRNNNNGGYLTLNNNPTFKDVLICENIPIRQGVSASTAGTANTGSWGVYVQYGNNAYGSVISPNKKKTKIFSMGNDYHMMYRVLSTNARNDASVTITDADYSESQRKIYSQMVKMVKKLTDYHQKKLDAIPDDATEESLLAENKNDRYIVDMWSITKSTGVKVTPLIYYSTLYPIFAPQFEKGGRVAWVNKILVDFIDDELENPEIKPWIPLSKEELRVANEKNYAALVAPPVFAPPVFAPPVFAPPVATPEVFTPSNPPSPYVNPPRPIVAVMPQHPIVAVMPQHHAVAVPTGPLTSAQQRTAARIAANKNAAAAVAAAAAVSTSWSPPIIKQDVECIEPTAIGESETEKRPDTNIEQNQYLTQTTTTSGRSRSSLVIKHPPRR